MKETIAVIAFVLAVVFVIKLFANNTAKKPASRVRNSGDGFRSNENNSLSYILDDVYNDPPHTNSFLSPVVRNLTLRTDFDVMVENSNFIILYRRKIANRDNKCLENIVIIKKESDFSLEMRIEDSEFVYFRPGNHEIKITYMLALEQNAGLKLAELLRRGFTT